MTIDWDEATTRQPLLRVMPDALRRVAVLHHFNAGETLFRRGERPKVVLCVLDGEIRLVRHSPAGAEIVVQRSRGGFVAEASFEAKVYHCDIVTAEKGRLLLFPLPLFRAALDGDRWFNRAWIGLLAREVRRLRAQCERLSLNSAAERILHYLEAEGDQGTITLTQSRKAWAAELGLSHEVVYRTLRKLQDAGTLVVDGDRLTLLSRER